MQHSESIKNLAHALSKAQAEMPAAKMNSVNPFLKNKFADLGSVIDTARPILDKYELAISQFPASDGDRVGVETIVMHVSGEWISNTILMSVNDEKGKSEAQVVGSIISYLRRYSFSSVLAMYADEDTDGNSKGHAPAEKDATGSDPEQKQRVWTLQQKTAIVDNGYAENLPNAQGMLNLSALPENAGLTVVVSWAKYYREARDEGKDQTNAASYANGKYIEAKKGAK